MLGDLAAITCALCFAFCSIAFTAAGRTVGAAVVNRLRLLAAVVVLAVAHLVVFGNLWPAGLSTEELSLLAVSGLIGLAIGDQCYFYSLTILGPRVGTLLMATAPMFSVLGDGLLREHWPGAFALLWMGLCVAGVALVLGDRRGPDVGGRNVAGPNANGRVVTLAILAGAVGSIGQGFGLVLTRMADEVEPASDLDSLSMTLVRMVAGMVGMVVLSSVPWVLSRRRDSTRRPMTGRALAQILFGVLFGPTLGVWLSTVAVQSASGTGRAAVLIALTPVMMIPIAWGMYGDRPRWMAVLGTCIAFAASAALLLQGA